MASRGGSGTSGGTSETFRTAPSEERESTEEREGSGAEGRDEMGRGRKKREGPFPNTLVLRARSR